MAVFFTGIENIKRYYLYHDDYYYRLYSMENNMNLGTQDIFLSLLPN